MHSIAHNDNFYAFARIKVAMKLAVKLQVIHGMSSQDALSKMEAMLQEHERRIKTLEQKLGGGGGGGGETVVQQQQQQQQPQQPVSLTPKVISIRAFILEKSPTDDV